MEIYDSIQLKDMIRKLRLSKGALIDESVELKRKLDEAAAANANCKLNLNSLGVDDEIRQYEGDETIVLDKKFLIGTCSIVRICEYSI